MVHVLTEASQFTNRCRLQEEGAPLGVAGATSENSTSAHSAKSPILTPFATGVELGVSTLLLQAPAALQLLDQPPRRPLHEP
jgi:hypothetical protein